jgi:hypothetical protein
VVSRVGAGVDRVLRAFPAGLSEETIDAVLDEVRKESCAARRRGEKRSDNYESG